MSRSRLRSPFDRGRTRLRTALLLVVGLAPALACRSSQATGPNPALTGTLDPGRVAPEFEADWEAVRRAQASDPAAPEVAAAADRLLSREPPRNLRLAALQAKAEQALRAGDHASAQRHAAAGLAEVVKARAEAGDLPAAEQGLASQLARVQALAEAMAGDPQQALQWLAALPEAPDGERLAATAIARERAGDRPGAVLAFAQWRTVAADDSPEAALAESRMKALWAGLDPGALETAARGAPGTPAAACLLNRAGHAPDPKAPIWVADCRPGTTKVGFLLPRSGKFAGLADLQLAAATAAVQVLARGAGKTVEVLWQDAGSTPAEVARATTALLRSGVDVMVGPVGPGNVEAAVTAASAAGGKPRFVVPGEATAAATGVAPSLEARSAAIAAQIRSLGLRGAVVLAPENGYGKRAGDAVNKSLSDNGIKMLKILSYPDDMTSFAKLVAPVLSELRSGVALVVPDRLGRLELLLRQLVRSGMTADRGDGKGVAVLSTGEGLSADALGPGHEILDGVWLAPVAWPTPDGDAFADAYTALEGQPPGDQAWLVWRAVAAAWGGPSTPPVAAVLRVEGGRLVPAPAQVQLRPRETRP